MSELEPTRTCSNPTATEILRRMLDERGVEHYDGTECTLWLKDGVGYRASADEGLNGFMQIHLWCTTPEQAIAATLGTGTCHNTQFAEMDEKAGKKYSMAMSALRFGGFMPEDEPAEFTCSACGETALIDWETLYDIRFCPFCGRRVKKVAE